MPTLLIVGATSDIARACAREFSREGYDLILAARNYEEMTKMKNNLEIRFQNKVQIKQLDITKIDEHQSFYNSLDPKPAGVLMAVGYLPDQKKAEIDWKECENTLMVNYIGPVSLLYIIANDFENRKKGFIIGISSVAGDRGRKSNYIYGSAKEGFTVYLSGLRGRLEKAGVHVLTIKPGFVHTRMTAHLNLPEKLTATPDDVAKDIFRAFLKRKDIIYTKRIWQFIMYVLKLIPESIFKKLNF